eukprot:10549666-Prorocentrum_lima.AAC.1
MQERGRGKGRRGLYSEGTSGVKSLCAGKALQLTCRRAGNLQNDLTEEMPPRRRSTDWNWSTKWRE